MIRRTLGLALLVALAAAPVNAQECAADKPTIVSAAVPRGIGKGPVWLAAESFPIKWKEAGTPIQLIWLSDAAARGPVLVSGKHRDSGAQVKFTKLGDIVGKREVKYRLDPIGYQPSQAKPIDFKKFNFDRTFGWFPAPGCYEIIGQIGLQQSKMVVHVISARSGTKP